MGVASDNSQGEQHESSSRVSSEPVRDVDDHEEVDLSSLLDKQIERDQGDSQRANKLILKICAAVVLLLVIVFAVSAKSRREVGELIQNVRESRDDLDLEKTQTEFSKAYDDVMTKLGSRSGDIDRATRSLGVDPSTVKEDGMDPEMKQMMGGEGTTAGERARIVEKLAGMTGSELPKPAKEEKPAVEEAPLKPGAELESEE